MPVASANSACHTFSVTNGTKGASNLVSISRQSCKVCNAAGSPSQNRRRERRTYQFDRSSTSPNKAFPARAGSYASSASSTSAATLPVSFRAQVSSGVGSPAVPGVQSFARAYND